VGVIWPKKKREVCVLIAGVSNVWHELGHCGVKRDERD
jgi:hypothetical protein